MAVQTGRTVSRFINFSVEDDTDTMREIPVTDISVVGVVYEEQDMTAFQDAVKSALPNMPDAPIEISGPFDSTAVQAASASAAVPALSGSHTVLNAICGGMTPLALDVQFGIRHTYEAGEPQFGISSDSDNTNGYICTSYTVGADLMYSAKFVLYPGSTLPAWGIALETVTP